jgi:recombinational DNA repair ATPase RecF
MIQIQKIQISKFRGIHDLELDLKGNSFAICGPNGTGKSGVVDAIEYALTGDISRLSGKGRGNVTLREHAPHVDYRDSPDDAWVKIECKIASSGKAFSITRTVAKPKQPTISPVTPDIQSVLSQIDNHKTISLSRRELIDYILSTPGDRATQIQALLKLGQLSDLRKTLQKISNSKKKDLKAAELQTGIAESALCTALDIPKLTSAALLKVVNEKRKVLGLPEIAELLSNTNLKDGLSVVSSANSTAPNKAVILQDLAQVVAKIATVAEVGFAKDCSDLAAKISALAARPDFTEGLDRREMLERALRFADEMCPVCDMPWKTDELVALLRGKIEKLDQLQQEKSEIENLLGPVVKVLTELESGLSTIIGHFGRIDSALSTSNLSAYSVMLQDLKKETGAFKELEKISQLLLLAVAFPSQAQTEIDSFEARVKRLPDANVKDAARDLLVAAGERLDAYRATKRVEGAAKNDSITAEIVSGKFEAALNRELNTLYAAIQDTFSDLYSKINSDDESAFTASMKSDGAQLGLDVEFYGRGKFPPGAYHSEGHQDGMGLCLFLALMKHLYKDDFKICVLDDVLMSVDSGHRRAVCELLQREFPKTQFILTTHDDVWLKNMQATGLVQQGQQIVFRNWSVETGPIDWKKVDVWGEIAQSISNNEIDDAAGTLRRYLEFISGQLCHNLRSQVTFRGDHKHTLGDLFPPAVKSFGKYLETSKKSAASWKKDAAVQEIQKKIDAFQAARQSTNSEQWAVNAKVHYNEWANLHKKDFEIVVSAYRDLIDLLTCAQCHSLPFVLPDHGDEQALRCSCGDLNLNLVVAKKT